MKNIFQLILILAILGIPLQSYTVTTSISDSELSNISAQAGSITVRIGHVVVESRTLKSISTDGWNYWDSDHDLTNHLKDPHPQNASGYFDGNSSNNPQKNPGAGAYDEVGYIGYDQVRITGGTVIHSGSMSLEVVSTTDPHVMSGCKLEVLMNHSSLEAPIAVEAVVKLSQTPDLAGEQALGRVYTSGISQSMHGHLTVYAHNNSLL